MGHVIITTAILVVCFLVNADFVGKTCSQHHWNIVVSIYFWFCLQSKVSRKGRWSLPRMFFVAFVQFVSKLFFPKMYWDFNGWACNPAGGPQDPQGCNYCNYSLLRARGATCWRGELRLSLLPHSDMVVEWYEVTGQRKRDHRYIRHRRWRDLQKLCVGVSCLHCAGGYGGRSGQVNVTGSWFDQPTARLSSCYAGLSAQWVSRAMLRDEWAVRRPASVGTIRVP